MLLSFDAGWLQAGPNAVASRTPSHRALSTGGLHRNAPTGGSANGIPLKILTPCSAVPRSAPAGARTIESDFGELMAKLGWVHMAAQANRRTRLPEVIMRPLTESARRAIGEPARGRLRSPRHRKA